MGFHFFKIICTPKKPIYLNSIFCCFLKAQKFESFVKGWSQNSKWVVFIVWLWGATLVVDVKMWILCEPKIGVYIASFELVWSRKRVLILTFWKDFKSPIRVLLAELKSLTFSFHSLIRRTNKKNCSTKRWDFYDDFSFSFWVFFCFCFKDWILLCEFWLFMCHTHTDTHTHTVTSQ